MFRRITNVELKKLQLLSRRQKCCRFKASRAAASYATRNSLSNLKKRKITKKVNQKWDALTAAANEDLPADS